MINFFKITSAAVIVSWEWAFTGIPSLCTCTWEVESFPLEDQLSFYQLECINHAHYSAGEFPTMRAGESFSWTSYTTFPTTYGSMRGYFTMRNLKTGNNLLHHMVWLHGCIYSFRNTMKSRCPTNEYSDPLWCENSNILSVKECMYMYIELYFQVTAVGWNVQYSTWSAYLIKHQPREVNACCKSRRTNEIQV